MQSLASQQLLLQCEAGHSWDRTIIAMDNIFSIIAMKNIFSKIAMNNIFTIIAMNNIFSIIAIINIVVNFSTVIAI